MSSLSVIRARLLASEEKLSYLWQLMAQPYSQLIQLLLDYIANHPDFPTWLDKFRLPDTLIKEFITTHQTKYLCQELPGRFRQSAVTLVKNIYKSWFAHKKSKLLSLQGKKRFLSMLKSDEQLLLESGYDLYTLTSHAQNLLQQVQLELEELWQQEGIKPEDEQSIFGKITNKLYELHDKTQSIPKRCVIAYLIKNGNQIRGRTRRQRSLPTTSHPKRNPNSTP
ncbi:type V CRISPR-associated protein Cas12k [Gloeothece verrucosa]|uniref:type V CRISPR-associated protein Cas12k n=1 Tax=Gloeothece verrucosa TaxID=2546359 RepID=UPI0005A51F94|nr:type V CRISPR-associated protein Cas12k [Gloeothece verrucosa]